MAMTTKKPQPRNKLWIIHASTLRRFSRVEHSDNWRLPKSQIWGDLCAFNHSLIIRRQKYSGIHERNMMSSVCIGTRHAASFLKKSLDQQYDLFKCLSGYTGRRERRRLTNIIFCIIAHFLLFFFLQCLLRLDAMSVRKWRRLIKWCIVFANDRRFAVLSSYQS